MNNTRPSHLIFSVHDTTVWWKNMARAIFGVPAFRGTYVAAITSDGE